MNIIELMNTLTALLAIGGLLLVLAGAQIIWLTLRVERLEDELKLYATHRTRVTPC
jgi:hypothetical protein